MCALGNTGSGIGIVFYVSASNFTSTGSDCGATCKYLEAAPDNQSSGLGIVWATNVASCYNAVGTTDAKDCQLNSIYSSDATAQAASRTASEAIGMGMANTNRIHSRLTTAGGVATSDYAAGLAFAYTNNGKTDWHLPSRGELNVLITQQSLGGTTLYTSSEAEASRAWRQNTSDFTVSSTNKAGVRPVRAVRAFG